MNDATANPIFVVLLFILRCLVPLAILFGISYLLRKMGLVSIESTEPPESHDGRVEEDAAPNESGTNSNITSTVEDKKES